MRSNIKCNNLYVCQQGYLLTSNIDECTQVLKHIEMHKTKHLATFHSELALMDVQTIGPLIVRGCLHELARVTQLV